MKIFKISALIVFLVSSTSFAYVANILELEGKVMCLEEGNLEWKKAKLKMGLNEGDRLIAESGARAVIQFNSGHTAVLNENSSIVIALYSEGTTMLEIFKGKLRSKVKKLSRGQCYSIKTPQAVCAVRGTDFVVSIQKNTTELIVYEGLVEAKEMISGKTVEVSAGHMSVIIENKAPSNLLIPIPEPADKEEKEGKLETEEWKIEARKEMFEEISRDAVLERAADEIKRAEYENGKALIDAHGKRVRLEEYIVRNEVNQFKYVVLNHRENRFDFGKILFVFDKKLPDDLSVAAKNMFSSKYEPRWTLTDLTSVTSNTQDQVNEEATGGEMISDSKGVWRHYFGNYEFSIKGYGRPKKLLWKQTIADTGEGYKGLDVSIEYVDAGNLTAEQYTRPKGDNVFHLRIYNKYADGTWIQADDYLIDDDGDVQSSMDLKSNFDSELRNGFKNYLARLNFERKYTSSEFGGRDIDLVFSTKLLLDSGMLSSGIDSPNND